MNHLGMDLIVKSAFLIACLMTAAMSEPCKNRTSPRYEYFICDVNLGFNASREYCQETYRADLVTYPDETEYNFTRDMLRNYTIEKSLPFYDHFLGVYQAMGSQEVEAYSGAFYWVDNPQEKITPNSLTYWKPIEEWIRNFDNSYRKNRQTFTMRDGAQVSGDIFNTDSPVNASILCQRKISSIHWYIESIRPTSGPIAGGTMITVTGGNMYNLTISRIEPFLAGFTIRRRNLTVVEIRTPSYQYENTTVNLTLRAELYGGQPYIGDDVSFSFQYRPNPVLENITPRRSILSGGLLLTVTGKYLDSVDKPMMLIHFRNSSDITVISVATICVVKNPEMMLCPTPNLRTMYVNIVKLGKPASMFLSSSDQSYSAAVTTTSASTAMPARSKRMIANHDNPLLDRPNVFVYKKEIRRAADRLKRQASSGGGSSLDGVSGYTFSFGFQFDGLQDYADLSKSNDTNLRDLSKISLYVDPDVTHFAEDGRVKVFQPEDRIIEIDGTTMTSGSAISDYRVTVGLDGVCDVTSLSTNNLKCRPPTEQPLTDASHYKTYNGKEVPHVAVKLGNLNWSAGYLFYKTSPWDDPKVRAGIIAMIVCLIMIAFVVGGVWLVRRRMRKNARRRNLDTDSLHDDPRYHSGPGSSTTKPFLHDKISPDLVSKINKCRISSANLSVGNMVGKGNFGKVFRGHFRKDDTDQLITVAVKSLRDGVMSLTDLENFLTEATIMIDFEHPNVLTLIGVVWEKIDPPLVVLPYMDHGDLKSLLKKDELTFQVGDLLHFALQIAHGMGYLAHHRFVHRDLAARNCMVNSDYLVKIADFGLSVDVYDTEYYRSETKSKPLPIKWMAIESIKEGRFTIKSDVWAFGITMWEIITRGSTPYPAVNNYDLRSHLEAGRRLDQPEYCPTIIYELMLQCWIESPQDRPTFTELAQRLSGVLTPSGSGKGEELYCRDYTTTIADDCLDPIMSEDRGPEPIMSENHGPEPIMSEDHGPEPIMSEDHGPEPIMSEDRGPEPIMSEDHGPEQIMSEDRGPEPIMSEDHRPEPIMSEDHTLELNNHVVGDYLAPITSHPDYCDTSL